MPMLIGVMGLIAALIWSFAKGWFSSGLSHQHKSNALAESSKLFAIVLNSGILAITSALTAVGVVFMALSWARPYPTKPVNKAAVFLPLLVPQISFLFGLQIGLNWASIGGVGQH